MAQTRMKNDAYKKILIRIPPDILAALEKASHGEDRSINGQLVHVLRQWVDQQEDSGEAPPPRVQKRRTPTTAS